MAAHHGDPPYGMRECPTCEGKGVVGTRHSVIEAWAAHLGCPNSRLEIERTCSTCGGSGWSKL